MSDYDFPREAYLGLADELSAEGATLAEFDPEWVAAAEEFAALHGLPWPIRDVDIALDLVRRAERKDADA